MNKVAYKDNVQGGPQPTWCKVFLCEDDRDIMWKDLLEIARQHWEWVIQQGTRQQTYTSNGQGSCLVAALYLPNVEGGTVFLSTIPQGEQKQKMREEGAARAPAWWAANDFRNDGYHAEDGAIYLFEKSRLSRDLVRGGRYVMPDRDNPLSLMKMAVWGRHSSSQQEGELIDLCAGASPGKGTPSCVDVANTLNIDYIDKYKLREEARAGSSSTGGGSRGRGTASYEMQSASAASSSRYQPAGTGSGSRPHRSHHEGRDNNNNAPSANQLTGLMSGLKISSTPSKGPASKTSRGPRSTVDSKGRVISDSKSRSTLDRNQNGRDPSNVRKLPSSGTPTKRPGKAKER